LKASKKSAPIVHKTCGKPGSKDCCEIDPEPHSSETNLDTCKSNPSNCTIAKGRFRISNA
jgi:hypothetical protein